MTKTATVPGCKARGCPKAARAAGLCWGHYNRKRRAKGRGKS